MRRGPAQISIALALALAAPATARAQLPPLLPTPPSPQPAPRPPAPAPVPDAAYTGTVASQGGNPAQTNYVDDPSLTTPLARRWTRTIRPRIDRVVYGQGLLYMRTDDRIVAVEPRFGRQVWTSRTRNGNGALAYGAGMVVSLEDRVLVGRTARTGTVRWQLEVDVDSSTAVPIPVGDRVVVGGYRGVSAYDIATGARRWTARTRDEERDATSPASDGTRIYGVQGCEPYALDATTGAEIWGSKPSCTLSDKAPSIHRGRLYLERSKRVLDATSGQVQGSHPGGHTILAGSMGVFAGPGLTARSLTDGRSLWSKRPNIQAGGGSPLAVGNTIYGTNGTTVTALALDTGRLEQRIDVPGGAGSSTTLAVAPGLLVTADSDRLTAYESVYKPAASGVAAGTESPDVEFGKRTIVDGIVGAALRPARPQAAVLVDDAPFGAFRSALTVPSDGGGYFSVSARPQRNTRIRVQVGGARSNLVRLYVYPRFRSKLRRARRNPNRIRAAVQVTGPRGVRLGRRKVVLYIGRVAKRRFDRLGSGRLRASGRGRARGSVRFNAIRGVRNKDFLYFCIRGSSKLGLGRADVLDRRCGARRMPLRP